MLGDSLVAGFGLKASEAFPAQLERALKARGHAVEVINAGVSGDTTAGGLARVAWAVPERTDAVILELGANDALRGLDPARAKSNLDKIIATIKAGGAEVLLAGMFAPRSLGKDYVRAFDGMYPDLAHKYGLILYPFFLEGVALDAKLNLDDGLHPNPPRRRRDHQEDPPSVEQLIERARAKHAAGRATKGLMPACRGCSRPSRSPKRSGMRPVARPRAARAARSGSSPRTCTSPCALPATSTGAPPTSSRTSWPASAPGRSR